MEGPKRDELVQTAKIVPFFGLVSLLSTTPQLECFVVELMNSCVKRALFCTMNLTECELGVSSTANANSSHIVDAEDSV